MDPAEWTLKKLPAARRKFKSEEVEGGYGRQKLCTRVAEEYASDSTSPYRVHEATRYQKLKEKDIRAVTFTPIHCIFDKVTAEVTRRD